MDSDSEHNSNNKPVRVMGKHIKEKHHAVKLGIFCSTPRTSNELVVQYIMYNVQSTCNMQSLESRVRSRKKKISHFVISQLPTCNFLFYVLLGESCFFRVRCKTVCKYV